MKKFRLNDSQIDQIDNRVGTVVNEVDGVLPIDVVRRRVNDSRTIPTIVTIETGHNNLAGHWG